MCNLENSHINTRYGDEHDRDELRCYVQCLMNNNMHMQMHADQSTPRALS